MQIKKTTPFFFILFLFMAACGTSKKATKGNNLKAFYTMLKGTYSSEAQSRLDKDYFNISLVMHPIWQERTDGYWLYVEQAMSDKLDKPYRQRVYQLTQKETGEISSRIYTIDDPQNYVQLWNDKTKLDKLTFQKLSTKEGCDVIMKKTATGFEGGTQGKNCPSNLRGATYTSSEIVLVSDTLKSWDRGFDEEDKQVWGAEKGAYIFIK